MDQNTFKPQLCRRVSKGFTLAELMIVMAIILIVSAIGLANYGLAVARAKTARVVAEFRTLQVGIDAYAVDHNSLPRMAHFDFYQDPALDTVLGVPVRGVMSTVLTTPVAYVSASQWLDPFMSSSVQAALDERLYTYQTLETYEKRQPASKFWPVARSFYGDYRLISVGPDTKFDHGFANSAQLPYDPTNGTLSLGNIITSKQTQPGILPPIPALLGPH
jgi:prepilin-type N-terminal cleavage/methylation domain-containing protein